MMTELRPWWRYGPTRAREHVACGPIKLSDAVIDRTIEPGGPVRLRYPAALLEGSWSSPAYTCADKGRLLFRAASSAFVQMNDDEVIIVADWMPVNVSPLEQLADQAE